MQNLKVIIAGGRDFNDYELLKSVCDHILKDQIHVEIISGVAKGADTLGERYARDNGYNIKLIPADWDTHGRSAGYKRNSDMADYGNVLIAFWDGKSKGTKHMINLAKSNFLTVRVQPYKINN